MISILSLIVDHPCLRTAGSRPYFLLENPRYGFWFVSWSKPLLSISGLFYFNDLIGFHKSIGQGQKPIWLASRRGAVTSGRYAKQILSWALSWPVFFFLLFYCSFALWDTIHHDLEMWVSKGRFLLFGGRVTFATRYLYLYTYLKPSAAIHLYGYTSIVHHTKGWAKIKNWSTGRA